MSEPVVRVRDLVKHYPVKGGVFSREVGRIQAVDGISFDIHQGETLGLVGESGCGKSTVAKLMMGLTDATSGSIEILGQDITKLGPREQRRVRRDIQIVLQDPYSSLDPRMTVGDIVGEPFRIHPDVVDRSARRDRVRDLLDVVGLNPDHINRYPHQFSGGQRQRIGIARALALRPKIIVCDEPVSALDVSVQAQVINLLERLQDEFDLSYLFIAHDLSVVRHISDRIAVMYLGRVVEIGTDTEVTEQATHPYTHGLLSAVPLPDPTVRGRRNQIQVRGDVASAADPPSGCRYRTRCYKAHDVCAEQDPTLVPRESSPHPCACLFAQERDVVHAGETT